MLTVIVVNRGAAFYRAVWPCCRRLLRHRRRLLHRLLPNPRAAMMLARQQCCLAARPAAARPAARPLPGAAQPRRVAAQARRGRKQAGPPPLGFGSTHMDLHGLLCDSVLPPLERAVLTSPVPWQPPIEWPSCARSKPFTQWAATLVARLQAGRVEVEHAGGEPVLAQVQRLLRCSHPGYLQALGCSPAEAARAALSTRWPELFASTEDEGSVFDANALLLAYAALAPVSGGRMPPGWPVPGLQTPACRMQACQQARLGQASPRPVLSFALLHPLPTAAGAPCLPGARCPPAWH